MMTAFIILGESPTYKSSFLVIPFQKKKVDFCTLK